MSKPAARNPSVTLSGYETSLVRCILAGVLVVAGIAWMVVYTHLALDPAEFAEKLIIDKPKDPLPWMSDLYKWNYAIGFGLIFLGLIIAAHRKTPLGRGRGVVIGMLACFLIGLIWIVTYYFIGQEPNASFHIPVMDKLDQLNLLVGVGFMAVGFTFATKWE